MDTLVLVDVMDSHGMMLSRQRLVLACPGPPVLIGRDLACDIVLNDPYAAARHAALALREDGTVVVEDLGTHNGLIAGGERVRQAAVAGLGGASLQIGHSHLRIRTAADRLAPERPDLESLRSRHREYAVAIGGGLLCVAYAVFGAWFRAPDGMPAAAISNLLGGGAVLAAWFALWVFLGRTVRSRWQLMSNAAITLGAAALGLWLWWGIGVAVFATGMPGLRAIGAGLLGLGGGVALYLALRTATRLRAPPAAAIAGALLLLAGLAYQWSAGQAHAGDVNHLAPPGPIFPPAWSRQPGMRLERFLDEALDLRDAADQRGRDFSGAGPRPPAPPGP